MYTARLSDTPSSRRNSTGTLSMNMVVLTFLGLALGDSRSSDGPLPVDHREPRHMYVVPSVRMRKSTAPHRGSVLTDRNGLLYWDAAHSDPSLAPEALTSSRSFIKGNVF